MKRMHPDTPHGAEAPTIGSQRRAFRAALRAVDTQWRLNPEQLSPGPDRDRLLAPLIAWATRVAEPGTASHIDNVGGLAESVALAAGWDPVLAADLRIHGALHDVGKLGIDSTILTKPGSLTAEERRAVETHASLGGRLLAGSGLPLLRVASRVAAEHHEWWDGSGYPRGLAGEAIHPASRVIAIADVFDALTSPRPYRGPLPHATALRIMEPGRGTQFDPALFDAFLRVCSDAEQAPALAAA